VEYKDIKRIVELMDQYELSNFQLERENFSLKLKKGVDEDVLKAALTSLPAAPVAVAPAAPVAAAPAPAATPAAPAEAAAPAADGEAISSPMVGTFYRKPAPDADNFVEVGSTVSEGQTICIIEAMKVMNEIKAEKSGTITSIVAEEGNPVQFGDALFYIK